MIDSGAQFFCGGELYFRQLDELTITVSIAKKIADEDWTAYLEGTLALTRKVGLAANVSLICCVHAYPNARQRQVASDFMIKNYMREMERVAVITESTIVRGAMIAFSWIMPKLRVSAFGSDEPERAFEWLQQAGKFDALKAMSAWNEARAKLNIGRASLRPG